MSTIDEVRDAEKKVQELVARLSKTGASDTNNLTEQLKKATDDYAKAVRGLKTTRF